MLDSVCVDIYRVLKQANKISYRCRLHPHKQDAVLSQGGQRNAAVNFDRLCIEFYNSIVRLLCETLPRHGFLVGLCLQTAVNYLSKSDKYEKEPVRSHII